VLAAVLAAGLIAAGCGGGSRTDPSTTSTSGVATTVAPKEPGDTGQSPAANTLAVSEPANGARVNASVVILRGTAPRGDRDGRYAIDVIGEDDPGDDAFYTVGLKPRNGRWSRSLRLYRGSNLIYVKRLPPGTPLDASLARGTPGYTIVDFNLVRGSGGGAVPAPAQPDLSNASIRIRSPGAGRTVRGKEIAVSGAGSPDGATVSVDLVNSRGRDFTRETTVRDGRWRVRVPVRGRSGERDVIASIGDDTVDDKTIEWSDGSLVRLLSNKGAVGLTSTAVRRQLGKPDKTQDVGGTRYWYYEVDGNLFQLVISGGRVTAVNRY
jgi:hypothetical protein